ncbi:MAG: alpha/beta fold hydrolase [Acidimicrobiales bacterium]
MEDPPSYLPSGAPVVLPGRGQSWVWDSPGPAGADTVVLIHGWGSTASIHWCGCFRPLSHQFRAVAMDLRGHGRGIRTGAAFSLVDCADDLASLIETARLGRVILAGYSMGGPVALLVWRRHPELVKGLVLCATAARFGGGLVRPIDAITRRVGAVLDILPQRLRQSGLNGALRASPKTARLARWARDECRTSEPSAVLQAASALNAFDASDWVDEVDVPTAVLVTRHDRTISPLRQETTAHAIPGAVSFHVDGGHRVCIEEPGLFSEALRRACMDVAGTAAARDRARQTDPALS